MSDANERVRNRISFLAGYYAAEADRRGDRVLSMACVDIMDAVDGVPPDEVFFPPRVELWEAMHR